MDNYIQSYYQQWFPMYFSRTLSNETYDTYMKYISGADPDIAQFENELLKTVDEDMIEQVKPDILDMKRRYGLAKDEYQFWLETRELYLTAITELFTNSNASLTPDQVNEIYNVYRSKYPYPDTLYNDLTTTITAFVGQDYPVSTLVEELLNKLEKLEDNRWRLYYRILDKHNPINNCIGIF